MSKSTENNIQMPDFPLVMAGESARSFDPRAFAAEIAAARAGLPQPVYIEKEPSEAAVDQGHAGPQLELGTPLEDEDHPRRKPEAVAAQRDADKKRRQRRLGHGESRFTDVGTDIPVETPPYLPGTDPSEAVATERSPETQQEMDKLARRFAVRNALNILDVSKNDPKHGAALARARAEKPKEQ